MLAFAFAPQAVSAAESPFEGSGTESDPYLIADYEDLCKLSELIGNGDEDYASAYYLQTADIVANEGEFSLDKEYNPLWNGKPIDETNMPPLKWKAITCGNGFQGIYDGSEYVISGLYPDSLFGYSNGATIKNTIIDNSLFDISYNTVHASIVVSISNGIIENCVNNGIVIHSERSAGIAGYTYATEIRNCLNLGTIYSKTGSAAGICNRPYDNTIIDCVNMGTVVGGSEAAGICGSPHNSSAMKTIIVENCINYGDVKSQNQSGGIASYFWGEINFCTNMGTIDGLNAGGICANLKKEAYSDSDILQCYNFGKITTNNGYSAGIVGFLGKNCNVTGCVNNADITSSNAIMTGGICASGEGNIALSANHGNISGKDAVAGILGKAQNTSQIFYCYNTGNIYGNNFIGGILGNFYSGLIYGTSEYYLEENYVAYCYNVGTITSTTNYYGGITGAQSKYTIDQCYYLNSSAPKGVGIDYDNTGNTTSMDAASMKKSSFVTKLNEIDTFFAADNKNINNGYPILINVYPAMFDDIPVDTYYTDAVLWALFNGITTGIDETSFGPESPCTRAQFVTFLWRTAGCPEPKTTTCDFTDCDPSQYYYPAVLWAVENGVTNGTSATTFEPDKTVNRAEVITFLWKYDGKPAAQGSDPFTDISDEWYAEAVTWGYNNGLAKGISDTTYGPLQNCTRAQTVTFLYRYFAE